MAYAMENFSTALLFLAYGLVFFTTGVAIASTGTRGSKLKIARHLPLFALFAFTHALHEWLVLFLFLEQPVLPEELMRTVSGLRLLPALVSFCFLLLFGVCLLQVVHPRARRFLWAGAVLLPSLLLFSLLARGIEASPAFFHFAALRVRNLVGFPAALAAGVGLIAYAGTIPAAHSKVARNFTGAGAALILYGVLAGLVPTGFRLPLAIRVEMLRGIAGLFILHFLMNAMHIFELEREAMIEERLQRFAQAEKLAALGKLAAGIAHEINNPLANASINVELLRKEVAGTVSAVGEARFQAIERNIDRASRIAQGLLFSVRQGDAEFVDTDLNEVIHGTLVLLGGRDCDFRIRLELADLPPIRAVPWKLEEVFLNILGNAMEASSPGALIRVRSRVRKRAVVAEVLDHGAGIPAENLTRIFEPFFSTKEVGRGTGLGLAVSFGIMESHGGRIEVDSVVGEGTTVSLVFPLPEAASG